jgi:C-terminal processing protease CtpA/Prc
LHEPRTVKLSRQGDAIIGLGIETKEEPRLHDFPMVTSLADNSLAAACGAIFIGDSITHLNGQRMAGVSREQLLEALTGSNELELVVVQRSSQEEKPSMPGSELLSTTLSRTQGSLGLEVVTIDGESLPVIKRVLPGSVAEQDGIVQRGDRVVAVSICMLEGLIW